MGSRPSSTLIYGFVYVHDWKNDEPDLSDTFTYELDEQWEKQTLKGLSCFSDEGRALLREHGTHVCWGSKYDDPNHAFGFVLAEGDWDQIPQRTVQVL